MMRLSVLALVCGGFLVGVAQAAPVSESEARKFLFPARGADLVVKRDSGLDEGQLAIVEAMVQGVKAQGQDQYYGALAVSPTFFDLLASEGDKAVFSGLFQIAIQYHSAEAAGVAALMACDKARKSRQADCVIAAEVLPRKWAAQPLQMSLAASAAFRDYRKGSGPKAFAISPATTAFAYVKGETAGEGALTRCNAAAKALGEADCAIVIED